MNEFCTLPAGATETGDRTGMTSRRTFLKTGVSALVLAAGCRTGGPGKTHYPGWQPGEMDIHFIHTGTGEQTFFRFPDGTTMLLDCGHASRPPAYVSAIPPSPSAERTGGEWTRRYLERVTESRAIDYLMVSHWHSDHVSGIPDVAQDFRFRTFLCHQFGKRFQYRKDADPSCEGFVSDWLPRASAAGMREEPFRVGALNQLCLRHDVSKRYGGVFEIRNIAANGVVWDGASGVRDCAAEHVRTTGKPYISENTLSAAIRIRYGSFTCFFGGDIGGNLVAAGGARYSYEGLVGSVVGPVDVCKSNHHAYWDSMLEPFVRAVRPRVYLSSTWSPNQINDKTLPIMTSRDVYPGKRTVFLGYLPEEKRAAFADRPFFSDIAREQGHVVVKVASGGDEYEVFVLNAADESMSVLSRQSFASAKELK